MPTETAPLIYQLGDKFTFDPDGCWRWTAARFRKGYGMLRRDGKNHYAHRLVYELIVGPIPTGLQLDHLCRIPECVNPASQ